MEVLFSCFAQSVSVILRIDEILESVFLGFLQSMNDLTALVCELLYATIACGMSSLLNPSLLALDTQIRMQ